jgi:hypothetical protein
MLVRVSSDFIVDYLKTLVEEPMLLFRHYVCHNLYERAFHAVSSFASPPSRVLSLVSSC